MINLESVQQPYVFNMSAICGGITNSWALTVLPTETEEAKACIASAGEFTAAELEPTFEEKSYSSGWGLPCASWKPLRQWPRNLLPHLPVTRNFAHGKTIVTSRLTREVAEALHDGGRVVLLAGPHAGGIDSKWINTWGVLPLVAESDSPHGIIRRGESDAMLPLIMHDLLANSCRVLPTDDLGIVDHVDPVIRLAWTHDSGVPKSFDLVCSARVSGGLLLISAADHTTEAGKWLLGRLIHFASESELKPAERELDISKWVIE